MLKLGLALFVSTLLVSCFGKPLEETNNEEVTDAKNLSDDAQRSGLTEDAKPLEADSSTIPVEIRSADIKTINQADDAVAIAADDAVAIAAGDARTGVAAEASASDTSKTIDEAERRSLDTKTINAAEDTGIDFAENLGERTGKLSEEKSRKREVDPENLEGTRRILIGVSLDDEADSTADVNKASIDSESRNSDDRASLEPAVNLDEILPTRTGNVNENGADLEGTRRLNGGDQSEVNIEVDSSRNNQDEVQENASTDERKGDGTTLSETRSAIPTTSEVESTPELRSDESDHTFAAEVNSERSGVLNDDENARINTEDSNSKSATTTDEESETADAADRSAKELVEATASSESRSGAPTSHAADESTNGALLVETNADGLSDTQSRTGQTTANVEASRDGAIEMAPEVKSGENSNLHVEASSIPARRMLSDDQPKGSGDSRTGLESEAVKDVSAAGSPAEQSRLASPSYTPLGFPTIIPVPMRRSIHPFPSIIVTKIPSSDIITLPRQLGSAANFLQPNSQQQRRHLDIQNEIDASDNGYAGEERAGENESSGNEAESNGEYDHPESLLRIDDYADDFNNYNLKSHMGSPAANPEARYNKPETASDLAIEASLPEHGRRRGEESYPKAVPPQNFAGFAPKQASKTNAELQQPSYPKSQALANPFAVAGVFLPRYSNFLRQADPFMPSAKQYLPEVESSLKTDSVWPKPLVKRLIQATTLASQPRHPQQNRFDLFYPYSLYYPSNRRYF